MSVNRNIAKASILLFGISILGHALSLYKEMIVAAVFGVTSAMDAYYAALTIPVFINNVFVATFGSIFIPLYMKKKVEDRGNADRLAAVITNYFFLLFLLAGGIMYAGAPLIMRFVFHGLDAAALADGAGILRILSFSVVLSGLVGIVTGILNAFERFAAAALSQAFITICTIVLVVLFSTRYGAGVLAYGLIAGLALQLAVLVPLLGRAGYRHNWGLRWQGGEKKEVLWLLLTYLLTLNINELNTVVDRVMASFLGTGSVAALGYAVKLIQVPILIFAISITTAIFPYFSRQAAEGKLREMNDTFTKSVNMSLTVLVPVTVMLMLFARPLIELLFQRGAFDAGATELISTVFRCYALQILFFSIITIAVRVIIAFQDVFTFLKVSCAGVLLNAALNLVMMKLVNPPVAGIALSTSFVLMLLSVVNIRIIERKLGKLDWAGIRGTAGKVLLSSAVMGALVYILYVWLLRTIGAGSVAAKCAVLIGAAVPGSVVYVLLGSWLRMKELRSCLQIARDRLVPGTRSGEDTAA